MNTPAKLLLVLMTVSALTIGNIYAQDTEEPNRLSIGLMGGVTMGHMNIGTEFDPIYGLNFRYAANPTIAVQTNLWFGKFTTNDEDNNFLDRSFENSYFQTSVTSQIALLRLLGSTSESVNVYANVGLGLIFNDVTTDMGFRPVGFHEEFLGENHTENAFYGIFGAGVRFNLARNIDLFAQYDYNISNSDLIDGHRTRPRTDIDLHRRTPDSWSSFTAGIQIKFGSSSKDADWHPYTPGVDMSYINRLEEKIAEIESRMDDHGSRIDRNEEHIRALERRMDEFDEKIANLHTLISERESVELTVGNDILFALDSSVIRETAKPALAEVARALLNHPERRLQIIGHTCDLGTTSYNQGLSERRAESVKQYLVNSGISADRIQTSGLGETSPLVPNTSEEARALNRRVEMVID